MLTQKIVPELAAAAATANSPSGCTIVAMPAGASAELQEMLRRFKRQALHAEKLSLAHPVTGETINLQIDPPADFQALLAVMGQLP